jgi:hypothetical protein
VSVNKFLIPRKGPTSDAQGKKLLRPSIPVDHVYRMSDSNHPLLLQRKEEHGILPHPDRHAAPKFRVDGFRGTKVQEKRLGAAAVCFGSIDDSVCIDLLHELHLRSKQVEAYFQLRQLLLSVHRRHHHQPERKV